MGGIIFKIFGAAGLSALVIRFFANDMIERRIVARQNFSEYSRRYSDLFAEIVTVTDITGPFDPDDERHRSVAVRFFMLLSEEEFLARTNLIEKEVVATWRKGLRDTMKHRFFQEAWFYVKEHLGCPLAETWVRETLEDCEPTAA